MRLFSTSPAQSSGYAEAKYSDSLPPLLVPKSTAGTISRCSSKSARTPACISHSLPPAREDGEGPASKQTLDAPQLGRSQTRAR